MVHIRAKCKSLPGFICFSIILAAIAPFTPTTIADIPNCVFEDTVNITGSVQLPDGAYLYKSIYKIPAHLVAFYEYETVYPNQTIRVERHLRGCICRIASCVKLCCEQDKIKTRLERVCQDRNNNVELPTHKHVTHLNGTIAERNLLEDFVTQVHLPCSTGYPSYNFTLFENGSVYTELPPDFIDFKMFSKRDYCLMPVEDDDENYEWAVYVCTDEEMSDLEDLETAENLRITYAAMIISQPFLIATIVVYAAIPELRNMHGKCLISYLTALSLSFILILVGNTASLAEFTLSNICCTFIGFLTYYFSISAFLWLGVISFDLWYNFKGTNSRVSRLTQQKRFRIYFLFVWSVAFMFMLLTLWAQHGFENPQLRPGIGEAFCWFDLSRWSAMIYFYGPVLMIIIFNMTVFFSTALKIHRVQKELSRFAPEKTDNNRHFNSEKDAYSMYLRLFVVMGLSWVFEVTSYLAGSNSTIFYVTDFFNASTGMIIFVLFVLKRKVRTLIKKRFTRDRTVSHKMHSRTPLSKRCASTTQTSGESLTHDTDMY